MAVNPDHYAIVVGLSRYPLLGEPPPSDLRGPVNDAGAVRDWLIDPNGGGLPQANVNFITSPDPVPPAGAPVRDEIQRAFADLSKRAEDNRNQLGALLGRRLYVYVSGHGFSPMVNQGCLLAGDAGGFSVGNNVFVTKWLEQIQDAGYFFETVLWMDCCMNRDAREQPSPPNFQARVSSAPPGPSFVAIAARRPLRTIEQADENGIFHGVFTTVLLEGLRGAAANPYGMVTGRSLADWVRNAQRGRLSSVDLADQRVSKEPDILKEDQALVFARGLKPATYPIELAIKGASGEPWKMWSGRPAAAVTGKVPASNALQLDLRPGLYVIEVPGRQLRQGFEVTGPAKVEVGETGPPVKIGSSLVPLTVDPSDATAEIYLVDESFGLVDRDIGKLATELPPAIYKTRIRSGDRLAEQVYLLDRSPTAAHAVPDLPAFAAAAPLAGSAFTHEYQIDALEHATDAVLGRGAGAQLLLMARLWRNDDRTPAALPPDAVLELWQGHKKLANLIEDGKVSLFGDPFATLTVNLDPGNYLIRRGSDGTVVEQAVVALGGWRTSFFYLVTPDEGEPLETTPPRTALLMHRIGEPFDSQNDSMLLLAQSAVGKSRAVLSNELDHALVEQPRSPLAAIVGGHLLILEQQKRPSLKIERLRGLVDDLRREFNGIPSADVDALALAISAPDAELPPIIAPPMFKASWDLITAASLARPALVPAKLFKRIYATQSAGPFTAWAIDKKSRSASREQLRSAIGEERMERTFAELNAGALQSALSGLRITGPAGRTLAFDDAVPAEIDRAGQPSAPSMLPPLPGATLDKLKALGLPASALEL